MAGNTVRRLRGTDLRALSIIMPCLAINALAGCSTYTATRYSISADTVTALRAFRPQKVNVGAFTAAEPGRSEIMCRAVGPIRTPDGEAFEAFIRKALVDELQVAEVYAPTAPVTLTGHVEQLDFSSLSGTGLLPILLLTGQDRDDWRR
jgi:hypothetical protein